MLAFFADGGKHDGESRGDGAQAPHGPPLTPNHPGDNIRANGTSQKWTRPGMPPDSGGILRGCPLLGGAICPNVVSRVAYAINAVQADPEPHTLNPEP